MFNYSKIKLSGLVILALTAILYCGSLFAAENNYGWVTEFSDMIMAERAKLDSATPDKKQVKKASQKIQKAIFTKFNDERSHEDMRFVLKKTNEFLTAKSQVSVLGKIIGNAKVKTVKSTDKNDLSPYAGLILEHAEMDRVAKRQEFLNGDALELSIKNLMSKFPDSYPNGQHFLNKLANLKAKAALPNANTSAIDKQRAQLRRQALLEENPLLKGKRLLALRRRDPGVNWKSTWDNDYPANWQGLSSLKNRKRDSQIVTIPISSSGDEKEEILYSHDQMITRMDLHFDADKVLFTSCKAAGESVGNWNVYELDLNDKKIICVTDNMPDDTDSYDACYTATDRIVFVNSSGYHGVPCVGGSDYVGNLHLLDRKSGDVRCLCFDQDNNWHPTMLANGRILFLRWEYTDSAHYFSRVLMHMNPDGTDQKEYYGSNSYWPNSLFYARPIPGSSSQFFGIVTGHHGVRRAGEVFKFDVNRGRKEATGVIQELPGYLKPAETPIIDELSNRKGVDVRFVDSRPLSEDYILVTRENGGLYLMDIFDNIVPIRLSEAYSYGEPILLAKQTRPPAIPDRIIPEAKDATAFISDVYKGRGMQGVPHGEVKSLRVFQYEYSPRNMGGHYVMGMESGWDVKILLGTVPVEKDGSAMFKIPANTPISLQPLDANGQAVQQMRSWLTAMPGEVVSCIGCHENQNDAPPRRRPTAALKSPRAITPWNGESRGFGFLQEVQPVLDRHCVGCHDGTQKIEDKKKPQENKEKPLLMSKWFMTASLPCKKLGDELSVKREFDKDLKDSNGKPAWTKAKAIKDGRVFGFKAGPGEARYFTRAITSYEDKKKVTFSFGSDDNITVWLNGKNVLHRNVARVASADQDILTLTLNKGVNRLTAQVRNIGGSAGFYFRQGDGNETVRNTYPNFANTDLTNLNGNKTTNRGGFGNSYLALHPYIRRNGPEGDYSGLLPMEFHVDTSPLIQMLKKGHHGVKLPAEDMERLATWIDLNVPYYNNWQNEKKMERRYELRNEYAGLTGDYETPLKSFQYERTETFIQPAAQEKATAVKVDGFPFGKGNLKLSGAKTETIKLADGVTLDLVKIPSGTFAMGSVDESPAEQPMAKVNVDKAFWMGTTEISLKQYRAFDAGHKNAIYDMHYKDQVRPGYDMDVSDEFPAIRVSWEKAMAFCKWLSEKTGRKVTLPTEAQWEWACRAGTDTPLFFGDKYSDFAEFANLADKSIAKLAVTGVDPHPIPNANKYWDFVPKIDNVNDGVLHLAEVGKYAPNAFGLKDITGNVAEWTRSTYEPYPYKDDDGRNDTTETSVMKTVRGGSWRDRPKDATSSIRWRYPQWQSVYNVGFRIIIED